MRRFLLVSLLALSALFAAAAPKAAHPAAPEETPIPKATLPGPLDAAPPSLPVSLLPEGRLEGRARIWAIGASGAVAGAALGWSLWEAWGMLKPLLEVLDSGDFSSADRAAGLIASDSAFQGRLFGFAFGILVAAFSANLLEDFVRGP
jgi:hypothetical protein